MHSFRLFWLFFPLGYQIAKYFTCQKISVKINDVPNSFELTKYRFVRWKAHINRAFAIIIIKQKHSF